MSISPLDSGNSKPLRSSKVSASKKPMTADSISLSQALIITAGMAGLIGLFSGVIIRFSLANSPNARFLSPLQTFPALSTWTPEPSESSQSVADPEGNATSRDYTQDEQSEAIRTFESSEPPDYLQEELEEPTDDSFNLTNDTDSVDATTFDTFADRNTPSRPSASGRWEALEAGPKFRQDAEGKPRPYGESELDSFDRDRSADVNGELSGQTRSDDNLSDFDYREETSLEDSYSEEAYPEVGNDSEVYSEDSSFYDDYPENY